MAYQFADGGDNYGNNYALVAGYPWDTVIGSPTVINTDFRFASPAGGIPVGCFQMSGGNYIRKTLSAGQTTIIMGFAFKCLALPTNNADICYLWNNNNLVMGLALNPSGQLQFWLGNGASPGGGGQALQTTIGSASVNGTIVAGGWYGVQIQVVVANSGTGSVACYINGNATPVITQATVQTAPGSITAVNQVSIGNQNSGGVGTFRYDDFFCFDGSGTTQNTLQSGDPRIITKLPSGAGNYTNWTPHGLGSNWQNAAVQPPNPADYNSNNTASTKDSYAVPSAGLTLAPFMVVVRASLTKDDANIHTPSLMVRSGSTDGVGAALPALGGSYLFYDTIFPNDPATSAPWSAAAADAAQIGVVEG